ncbi:apoptosis facilitator Bcl-2-like protein 14 [Entelurus aequoreus]|uniref:apoptosis facilitator Bcl-2-like protein 14 n=1 Tax=Entelurus aequoreus TaxID=161455 RepID=UPI002B1DA9DE|nr:apoptosis facilitator Bcl-2-like protein 14 [Entelurus aequoreus]XP_061923112.1 apoptosis facilitator Bcl-2-like protein 14 [Entelurus aequoreus]
MANGHIEIHDPFADGDGQEATSDVANLQNAVEFRLMMVYAQRRRGEKPSESSVEDPADATSPKSEHEKTPAKKKKKRRWKRLTSILRCIKPETDRTPGDPHRPHVINLCAGDHEEVDEIEIVASRLTDIADDIPFVPPEVEPDSPEEDANVEKLIGLLLRECGDHYDRQVAEELRDALRNTQLWNYTFYERLMQTVLIRMGLFNPDPEAPGPQTSPQTQIAVACEVTSRLSAADTLPMNRLMGYGATYLQNHFSSWAKQHGGYTGAIICENDDDDDEVQ